MVRAAGVREKFASGTRLKNGHMYTTLTAMIRPAEPMTETPTNQRKLHLLRQVIGQLLEEALRRGFYGSVGVEIVVEDGTIQYVRRRVEQVQR